MTGHTIRLRTPVPGELRGELASRIYFLSGAITGFRLVDEDGAVVAVELELANGMPAAELSAGLDHLVVNDVLGQRAPRDKVLWRSNAGGPPRPGIFEELVRLGAATPVGEGQVVLGSPLLELMDLLDRRLVAIAAAMGGVERRYPTLLRTAALHRCGYFTSFPQFAMFVTRLHTDLAVYQEFAGHARDSDVLGAEVLSRCDNVDYCLPPTMCYHTFHELDGAKLVLPGTVVTARGKSFRHESRYHTSLERLWDFTIRETVFLGDRDHVLRCRAAFLDRVKELVEELALPARLEVANDPFFASGDAGTRIWSQRLLELKCELRMDVEPGHGVAVGSFNLHDRFFGDAFGIRLPDGELAYSGCVGFGLERLAYAFVCRHGLDPGGWPSSLVAGGTAAPLPGAPRALAMKGTGST